MSARALSPALCLLALLGTAAGEPAPKAARKAPQTASADDLLIVDCLLPGQVRRLGRRMTYVSARRPIRTSAQDCEIRGGEYVAYDRANYATALKVWLPEAEGGDPEAQTFVGEIFEKGIGGTPDYEAAALWYRKAAEQGFARAQIDLGHLYELGLGVPADPGQALHWYRQAAGLPGSIDLETAPAQAAAPPPPDPAQAAEIARLQAELEGLRGRIAELEQGLAAAQESLTAAAAEEERLRQELERKERALDEAEQQSEAEETAAVEAVDSLRQQLAARQQELETERQRVTDLQQNLEQAAELERQAEQATARAAAQATPAVAPSIELIEPPLMAQRGPNEITVRGGAEQRTVVGRVSAPAGLLSFLVDDTSVAVDDGGLFEVDLPVGTARRNVALVAIDRSGQRSELDLVLVPETAPAEPVTERKPEPQLPAVDFGPFYALVIGNDSYTKLPHLGTAIADARQVAELLESHYGFETRLLLDASRYEILSALNELRAKLDEKSNLLIYYAGHGELDPAIQRGYWLPVDADPGNTANWISTATITDHLSVIPAKHILVVADSCYSGALTRSSLAHLEEGMSAEARHAWLEKMASNRSRTALTSGGLKPVLDAGGGGHSVFAKALLSALQENHDVLATQQLYREVSARVTYAAESLRVEQVPEYAPIRFAGHESGDFFFVPRG